MEREPTEAGPFRLLFVCTGNTCRSPMAEVIARQLLEELGWSQVEVASAGVAAFPGSPASGGAVRVAAERGLDLSGHASTPLTRELAEQADLILTMSASHLVRVVELGAGDRAAVITSFAEADRGVDEADRGVDGAEGVAAEPDRGVDEAHGGVTKNEGGADGPERGVDEADGAWSHGGGVPDPIGGPDEEYAATFRVLERLVARALERISPVVEP